MKKKETLQAVLATAVTTFIGYFLFFCLDDELDSEAEQTGTFIISLLTVSLMTVLTAIGWSVALPDKENDV